jgi:hypothetical protein
MQPPASDFAAILRVLHDHKVRFIVVGGIGAVLQGAPVTTFDLDIVHALSLANCVRLAEALATIKACYRGHPKVLVPSASLLQSSGHHLLQTEHGPLDVLGAVGRDRGYRELSRYARTLIVQPGLRVRVVPLSWLIKLKEETARGKDHAVLPILRGTLAEQERARRRKPST